MYTAAYQGLAVVNTQNSHIKTWSQKKETHTHTILCKGVKASDFTRGNFTLLVKQNSG